jgi:hypothetical protein
MSVLLLASSHELALAAALTTFDTKRFGKGDEDREALVAAIELELRLVQEDNLRDSESVCALALNITDARIVEVATMFFPSKRKYAVELEALEKSFNRTCLGPAETSTWIKVTKVLEDEQQLFLRVYDRAVLTTVGLFALMCGLVARFVLFSGTVEVASWLCFVNLELVKRGVGVGEGLWRWLHLTSAYEIIIFNPYLDLNRWLLPVVLLMGACILLCDFMTRPMWKRWCLLLSQPLSRRQKRARDMV